MDKTLYAADLLDTTRIKTWDKFFLSSVALSILEERKKAEQFKFLNKTVNVLAEPLFGGREEYYVADTDERGNRVVAFYAAIKYNQKRNNFLKPAVGRYQSAVWKRPGSLKGLQFATNFVLGFLLDALSSVMVTTDLVQSENGRDLWTHIVSVAALSPKYDCYYGLAAPSDVRVLIKVEDQKAVEHYAKHITARNSAYAFRSAIIVRADTPIDKILQDPENTRVTSNDLAERFDLYKEPRKLTPAEERLYYREYNFDKPEYRKLQS